MTDSAYDLIGVLTAAEYGSDELNCRVLEFFGWRKEMVGDESRGYFMPRSLHWVMSDGVRWPGNYLAPAVTQSIDAAKLLLKKEWHRIVWDSPNAQVTVGLRIGRIDVTGTHSKEAIATCIAAVTLHG